MNKIIIGIIIVVVLAGGIYLLDRQAKTPGVENSTAMIQEAYLGTGSVVCDFVDPGYEQKDGEEFILYIKNGIMRFSVESTDDLSGHIIIKDDYYYFWTKEGGIKMALEQTEKEGFFVPFELENGKMVIPEEDIRFSCRQQAVDDSILEIPANIEFMDMNEISADWQDFQDDFELGPEMPEGAEDLEDFDLPGMPEGI